MGNMFCPFKIRCQVNTQEFYSVNVSRCWLLIIRGWTDGWLVKKDTMNSLVFSTFSFILFAIDHWLTLSTSCCKVSGSDLPTLTSSERAQSSTYLYKGSWLAKSFTMIRKNRGPSLVPCGTPPLYLWLNRETRLCNT